MIRGSSSGRRPTEVIAPVNTVAPVISGTQTVGGTLTATQGTWTNSPDAFFYQWQRDESGVWTDIVGATGSSYVTVSGDGQTSVRVRVTAQNSGGATSAISNQLLVSIQSSFGASLPAPLPPSLGNGGTIYISPAGSDTTGTGTIANPYKTPHKAFQVVNLTGGLILARGGTYSLAGTGEAGIQQRWQRQGSHTNPPQIKAYPGESPVFSGTRFLIDSGTIPVGGLRIGPGLRITASPIFSGARLDGIKIERSEGYIEITGCEIDNNPGNGVFVGYSAPFKPTQVHILNCVIHDNGDPASQSYHGIYYGHGDASCLVANCVFYDNQGFAAQFGPESNDLIVTGCTSHSDGAGGSRGGFSIWTQAPENTNPNVRMFGCVCSDPSYAYAYSFSGLASTDAPQIHDSIWNGSSVGGIEPQTGLVSSNIVHADPQYVDAAGRDLRLDTGSPARELIDSSHDGYVYPTDILGNIRVTADAGAYAKEA